MNRPNEISEVSDEYLEYVHSDKVGSEPNTDTDYEQIGVTDDD